MRKGRDPGSGSGRPKNMRIRFRIPNTDCLYILYVYFGKGEGQREGRGATVHQRGRK
jgi:hypothetical protein